MARSAVTQGPCCYPGALLQNISVSSGLPLRWPWSEGPFMVTYGDALSIFRTSCCRKAWQRTCKASIIGLQVHLLLQSCTLGRLGGLWATTSWELQALWSLVALD